MKKRQNLSAQDKALERSLKLGSKTAEEEQIKSEYEAKRSIFLNYCFKKPKLKHPAVALPLVRRALIDLKLSETTFRQLILNIGDARANQLLKAVACKIALQMAPVSNSIAPQREKKIVKKKLVRVKRSVWLSIQGQSLKPGSHRNQC